MFAKDVFKIRMLMFGIVLIAKRLQQCACLYVNAFALKLEMILSQGILGGILVPTLNPSQQRNTEREDAKVVNSITNRSSFQTAITIILIIIAVPGTISSVTDLNKC